ncbi:MAG: ribosome small subunit-dependent GTPase A [Myxococcota bacterium]
MELENLGFTAFFQDAFSRLKQPHLQPARVVREDRGIYTVAATTGFLRAHLAGRLRMTTAPHELPATGDWCAVRPVSGEDKALIVERLPRRTAFMRKKAGTTTEAQVVAANVDVVFLVMGLDEDFNPRRLERYLALARDSGAEPVIILNKLDLAPDPDAQREALTSIAGETPILLVSAALGVGLDGLSSYVGPGRTVALLGSSGVGKSTLINALLGQARMVTREVRASDGRGVHTTTFRDLMLLPGGGAIMDTPGMRELQLWGDEDTVAASFPDVEALAATCRFRDCAHQGEPGCAVRQAVEDGTLEASRLASYRRLLDEVAFLQLRQHERHERLRKDGLGNMAKHFRDLAKKPLKRRW